MLNKKNIVILLILFFIPSLFINFSVSAENKIEIKDEKNITFVKAVHWGLENSYIIKKLEDEINKIE